MAYYFCMPRLGAIDNVWISHSKVKTGRENKDSGKWYNSIGCHNFNSGHTDIEIKISEYPDIEFRFNICAGYDIMCAHYLYIDS